MPMAASIITGGVVREVTYSGEGGGVGGKGTRIRERRE